VQRLLIYFSFSEIFIEKRKKKKNRQLVTTQIHKLGIAATLPDFQRFLLFEIHCFYPVIVTHLQHPQLISPSNYV